MEINEIRSIFLEYFNKNDHEIVHSSPLVPMNDPTLMFANSGMVQFKNIFTGLENQKYKRAVTAQKCIRAGGKHNDLDNVGYTLRHHTFFEMLGNFSFGDYFKDDAIDYAWKFMIKELGINKERLFVTIYHDDEQAYRAWKKISGFSDEKIIRISTNDNFWSMGETGPCGPCSEIFYDHGENYKGNPPSAKDETHDRFVEIWNLVFMQFEQINKNERIDLPRPSIDTGMGIERIAAVLQGTNDNYQIGSFQRIIKHSLDLTKNNDQNLLSSHRVIADHLRSSCFLIADGILPSNEGRGYVLRRIMRRAMRHVHLLGFKNELMYQLAPTLINEMTNAYPELMRAQNLIVETLKYEEQKFKDLLDRGMKHLNREIESAKNADVFSGESAFKLYDTYGFPIDLTQDILKNKNIGIDIHGFESKLTEQRELARKNWSGSGDQEIEKIWFSISQVLPSTEFIGYSNDESEAQILSIVRDNDQADDIIEENHASIILNQTVFYPESGGQVGDIGIISNEKNLFQVTDTQKKEKVIIHHGFMKKGKLKKNDNVQLKIDHKRRNSCRAYHSATHILHQALRDILGDHVTQKGSLVSYDRLRFDFSHHKELSQVEILKVEDIINKVIDDNTEVKTKLMKSYDAIESGALALFGEKYSDEVRVLSIGLNEKEAYSTELCGGTHVSKTSEIGRLKIINESSVASGVRRIEGLRGIDLNKYEQEQLIQKEKSLEKEDQTAELKKQTDKNLSSITKRVLSKINKNDLTQKIIEYCEDIKPTELRAVIDVAKQAFVSEGVIVICVKNESKMSYLVGVSKNLSDKVGANEIAQYAAKISNGKGGGGRKDFAQSGGDFINLESQIKKIDEYIQERI